MEAYGSQLDSPQGLLDQAAPPLAYPAKSRIKSQRLWLGLQLLSPLPSALISVTRVTYRFQHCRLPLLTLQPPGSMGSLRETHM